MNQQREMAFAGSTSLLKTFTSFRLIIKRFEIYHENWVIFIKWNGCVSILSILFQSKEEEKSFFGLKLNHV